MPTITTEGREWIRWGDVIFTLSCGMWLILDGHWLPLLGLLGLGTAVNSVFFTKVRARTGPSEWTTPPTAGL